MIVKNIKKRKEIYIRLKNRISKINQKNSKHKEK